MHSVNMEPHAKAGAPGSVYEHPIDIDEHGDLRRTKLERSTQETEPSYNAEAQLSS